MVVVTGAGSNRSAALRCNVNGKLHALLHKLCFMFDAVTPRIAMYTLHLNDRKRFRPAQLIQHHGAPRWEAGAVPPQRCYQAADNAAGDLGTLLLLHLHTLVLPTESLQRVAGPSVPQGETRSGMLLPCRARRPGEPRSVVTTCVDTEKRLEAAAGAVRQRRAPHPPLLRLLLTLACRRHGAADAGMAVSRRR